MTFIKQKLKEFDNYWGEAPLGTPKFEAGKKAKAFLEIALNEQKIKFRAELTEKAGIGIKKLPAFPPKDFDFIKFVLELYKEKQNKFKMTTPR